MQDKTVGQGCKETISSIVVSIQAVRALIVQSQEDAPEVATEGFTLDEAQAEVTENVILALRHLEDAAARLNQAAQVFGYTEGEDQVNDTEEEDNEAKPADDTAAANTTTQAQVASPQDAQAKAVALAAGQTA